MDIRLSWQRKLAVPGRSILHSPCGAAFESETGAGEGKPDLEEVRVDEWRARTMVARSPNRQLEAWGLVTVLESPGRIATRGD